eukprot:7541088-Pyramimonas_sp.AAC.1
MARSIPVSNAGDVKAGNLGFGDGERAFDLSGRLVERVTCVFSVGHPVFELRNVIVTGVWSGCDSACNSLDLGEDCSLSIGRNSLGSSLELG